MYDKTYQTYKILSSKTYFKTKAKYNNLNKWTIYNDY